MNWASISLNADDNHTPAMMDLERGLCYRQLRDLLALRRTRRAAQYQRGKNVVVRTVLWRLRDSLARVIERMKSCRGNLVARQPKSCQRRLRICAQHDIVIA